MSEHTDAFFRALDAQRLPSLTAEQLEMHSKRSRERLSITMSRLEDELATINLKINYLKKELHNAYLENTQIHDAINKAKSDKEKTVRTLTRFVAERAELESEAMLEEKKVADLKNRLNSMKIERDELGRAMYDEQTLVHEARITAHKRIKEQLESEERRLAIDILQLKASVAQGQRIRSEKLAQLRNTVGDCHVFIFFGNFYI